MSSETMPEDQAAKLEPTPPATGKEKPVETGSERPEPEDVTSGRSRTHPPATAENVEEYQRRFQEGMRQRQEATSGDSEHLPATAENVKEYENRFYGAMSADQLQQLAEENNPAAKRILAERQGAEEAPAGETADLAEQFRNYSTDVKEQFRTMAAKQEPKDLAKKFAQEGMLTEDQARELFKELYKDQYNDPAGRAKVEDAIRGAGFKTKEEAAVEPAPEPLTPREHEMQQAMEEYAPQAQEILSGSSSQEEKDEELEGITSRFRDRFPEATGKALGKILKYSTIGSGIFGFILVLLLAVHAPNKQ